VLATEPSLAGLSEGDAGVSRAFLDAARDTCQGFVIFTIVNKAEVCYMDNWMQLAHEVAVKTLPLGGWAPVIVFALDKKAHDACHVLRKHHAHKADTPPEHQLVIRCVKHPHFKDSSVRVHFGSSEYKKLVWTKTSFVRTAVDMGIPVLLMDLDITALKNPAHFLVRAQESISISSPFILCVVQHMFIKIHDGFSVQTNNEDAVRSTHIFPLHSVVYSILFLQILVKPNTGFVFVPGWHVGGG
jgi:hypothetical protein